MVLIKNVQRIIVILNNKNGEVIRTASATSNGMNIVDVIPLSRGIKKETLSYFTLKNISVGDIVVIPLRKKEVLAIVVDVRDAVSIKSEIKDSPYGLRKIIDVTSSRFFLPAFITAAKSAARYFATGTGAVIETLTPSPILHAIVEKKLVPPDITLTHGNKRNEVFEKYVLQAPEKDRFATYKGIIREEFAKNHSVIFLVPTIDDIEYATMLIGRGIEEYTHTFHGRLTKQKMITAWHGILKDTHPALIVGTGMCLSIPRHDIHTVIVENEQSWSYKQERRPYIDVRTFAEHFTKALQGKLIVCGPALRVETLYRREQEEFIDFSPPSFHLLSSAEQSVVDMKNTHSPLQLTPKTFTLIHDSVREAIEDVREKNEHIFLFAPRRGLFTLTLCSDCGQVVLCEHCVAPLVLHKETKKGPGGRMERIFLCHKCGEKNIVKDRCKKCDSWRQAPLGAGTERVEEEVKKLFPTIKIVRLDKDSAPSRKIAEHKMKEFLGAPGSVLIGTEMALNMLKKKIAVTAAISIDSLFALPSFRMNERVFTILLRMREFAVKKFMIQSRIPELSIFKYVLNGNIAEFYKEEKAVRHSLRYPPFTTLIKLTMEGSKQTIEKEVAFIKKHLEGYELLIFPAFISKVRQKYIMHAVIKTKPEEWPNDTLLSLLHELSPSVAINVDPEHLL
ncbi:MAG: hypothetical protein Q8R36_02195 [bacterium]|nr:hypothetical protein [bacterium]